MKRLLSIVAVVLVTIALAFGMSACVDMEEALPHYKMNKQAKGEQMMNVDLMGWMEDDGTVTVVPVT